MWLGGLLFEQVIDFIRQENPDILLLQEVYDGKDPGLLGRFRSLEVLQSKFAFPYQYFSPACVAVLPAGEIEAGNAVLSKLPIEKVDTVFFDTPFGKVSHYETPGGDFSLTPRNLQHAIIKAGDASLNVFNTQGIWGKDSEDNDRRLKMSEVIVEAVKSKDHVILVGDFNVMPHTKTIKNIENYLTNVFKDKLKTTFNLRQKSIHALSTVVVDMFFASPSLKVTDARCPDVDVSDHFPLVCTIEV